jgi:hypothetical protein
VRAHAQRPVGHGLAPAVPVGPRRHVADETWIRSAARCTVHFFSTTATAKRRRPSGVRGTFAAGYKDLQTVGWCGTHSVLEVLAIRLPPEVHDQCGNYT